MISSISDMQSVVLSMTLLLILLSLVELIIKKYIIIEETTKISDTVGKNINRWVKGLLAFICLFVFFFVLDRTDISKLKWFFFISFVIAMGQHIFMEWWYLKGSKEYNISFIKLVIGLIYIVILF